MPFLRSKRGSWSVRLTHAAPFVALLLLLTLAASVRAASDVSGTAWLSGPAALWSTVWGGSDTSTAATQLKAAIKSDFTTAITALDGGAGVTVSTLSPNTAPATGPAYGTQTTYTISSTTLTTAQVEDCLRSATLTNLNSLFATFAPSLSLTIKVLNADSPADVTQIVSSGYLPLTGASYMWEVVLGILNSAGTLALAGFILPIEQDLQSTIDSTGKSYLVVVPTDVTASIVNASALYVGYSVWVYPSNTAPATADTLQATAHTTPLTKFNTFVNGLESSYSALADYADLLPASVKVANPLIWDPTASTDTSDVVVVVGNVTGNYLLTFRGSASTWGHVWATQRALVSSTIVAAAEAELARRFFTTSVEVLSASTVPNEKKYVGGLQVVCYVSHGYSVNSSHVWSPEELMSMLLQGDYTATRALYTAAVGTGSTLAKATTTALTGTATTTPTPGTLATTGIEYDFTAKMQPYEVGVIVMAAVIGFLCFLAFFIACGCYCCCRHCISTSKPESTTSEWEANLDCYQRDMANQDEAFARAEHPHLKAERKHKKKSRAAAVNGTHDRNVSPNPLGSSAAQNLIYSPCVCDLHTMQQLNRALPPPLDTPSPEALNSSDNSDAVKKTPVPTVTAHGVPLDPAQNSLQNHADSCSYAQYHGASTKQNTAAAALAAAALPREDDERSGSCTKRPQYHCTVPSSSDPEAGSRIHNSPGNPQHLVTPPPSSPPQPNPENGMGYLPQYMANITPSSFFNLQAPAVSADATGEFKTSNHTRFSQESQGNTPTPAPPPPPSYPYFESPRWHQRSTTPPAYPLQVQRSPSYSPLPPATTAAYPSSDLYAGAPEPAVTTSIGSFTPMPSVTKKR